MFEIGSYLKLRVLPLMVMLAVCPAKTTSTLQEGSAQTGGIAETRGDAQTGIPDAKSIIETVSPAKSPRLRDLWLGFIEDQWLKLAGLHKKFLKCKYRNDWLRFDVSVYLGFISVLD